MHTHGGSSLTLSDITRLNIKNVKGTEWPKSHETRIIQTISYQIHAMTSMLFHRRPHTCARTSVAIKYVCVGVRFAPF